MLKSGVSCQAWYHYSTHTSLLSPYPAVNKLPPMKSKRPFLFVLVIPLVACALLGAAIFGGQAYQETQENASIRQTIADAVDAPNPVEVANLQRVQHGYGVCGIYRVADRDEGYSSFYYDAVNRKVEFDVNSKAFESNCGLASLCDVL